MSQMLLLSANPKRRKATKKRRSAAQRAATARMLAANPRRRRRSAARKSVARRASPVARKARRSVRRSRGASFSRSGAVDLLKSGAIGGAGAVAGDMLFAQAAKVLPDNMVSKLNADGSVNFLHYGAKAALAVGLGIYGGRVLPRNIAAKAAEGMLTVSAYELLKTMLPASLAVNGMRGRGVGYFNPARVLRGVNGTGKIVALPNRSGGMGLIRNAPSSSGAPLYNNGRMR